MITSYKQNDIERTLSDYLVQDGSARKHPFPIAVQLGSFK